MERLITVWRYYSVMEKHHGANQCWLLFFLWRESHCALEKGVLPFSETRKECFLFERTQLFVCLFEVHYVCLLVSFFFQSFASSFSLS